MTGRRVPLIAVLMLAACAGDAAAPELDPEVVEEKYYAAGVGMVLETTIEGGSGRVELISHTTGS